jgi:hypothetical protein
VKEKHPEREPWANCKECGQAKEERVLDKRGVCPTCTMPVITNAANPAFERR